MIKKIQAPHRPELQREPLLFVYTEKLNADIEYSWCKQICGLRNYKKSLGEFNPCGA